MACVASVQLCAADPKHGSCSSLIHALAQQACSEDLSNTNGANGTNAVCVFGAVTPAEASSPPPYVQGSQRHDHLAHPFPASREPLTRSGHGHAGGASTGRGCEHFGNTTWHPLNSLVHKHASWSSLVMRCGEGGPMLMCADPHAFSDIIERIAY